jgi:very-short-patch-repair endonuclease
MTLRRIRIFGGEGWGEGESEAAMTQHPEKRTINLPYRRKLRGSSTESEMLLWQVLRNRRLHGLKFRRQHSIGPYIVDFACIEQRLVVEVDGGYHEAVFDSDLAREQYLESASWKVMRIEDKDVVEDVNAVAVAIARFLGMET